MTITKSDIVAVVMQHSNLNKPQATEFTEQFFETLISALETEGELKISGFGNFIVRQKKSRIGRNPKTREEFEIKAH